MASSQYAAPAPKAGPPPGAVAPRASQSGYTGDPSYGTQIQVRTSAEGVTPETFQTIEGVGDIDGPSMNMAEIETTSHSTGVPIRTFIPSLIDPGTLSFPCFFNPSDPTHSVSSPYGLESLFYGRKVTKWRLINTDANQRTREFYGFVREMGESYPLEGVNTKDTVVRITGRMTDVVFTVAFTPATATPLAAGGPGTVAVGVGGSSAAWTPSSDVGWVTITSPTVPTTGDGDVAYTVAANGAGQPERTGHITVLGTQFTVTQAAGA